MSLIDQINDEIALDDAIVQFEQAYPGVAHHPPQGTIKVWWGDFRQERTECGVFVIGRYPIGDWERVVPVYNGEETTRRYPAIANGKACWMERTTFHPIDGHASYGNVRFVDV